MWIDEQKEWKAHAICMWLCLVNKGLKRIYLYSFLNLVVFCYFASLGCWSDLWGEVEDKNVKRRKNGKNPVIILATWKMQCTECIVLKMTQQVYCRVVVECRIGNSSHSNLPSSVVTRRRTEFLPFTRNSSPPPPLSRPIPPFITNKSLFSKNIFISNPFSAKLAATFYLLIETFPFCQPEVFTLAIVERAVLHSIPQKKHFYWGEKRKKFKFWLQKNWFTKYFTKW